VGQDEGELTVQLKNAKALGHENMVRPCHCGLNQVYTHQSLLRFDAAKIQVFRVEGGVIEDVAMHTRKCEISG